MGDLSVQPVVKTRSRGDSLLSPMTSRENKIALTHSATFPPPVEPSSTFHSAPASTLATKIPHTHAKRKYRYSADMTYTIETSMPSSQSTTVFVSSPIPPMAPIPSSASAPMIVISGDPQEQMGSSSQRPIIGHAHRHHHRHSVSPPTVQSPAMPTARLMIVILLCFTFLFILLIFG